MQPAPVDLEKPYANRRTLRFVEPLEASYLQHYVDTFLPTMRLALGLGLFLYVAFAAIDILSFPNAPGIALTIRFGIVTPLLILGLASTYSRFWRHRFQLLTMLLIAIATFGVMSIIIAAQGREYYFIFGGIPLCLMFAYGYARARYVYVVAVCAFITAVYLGFAVKLQLPSDELIRNAVALVAANLIGGFAAYSFEVFVRENYLQSLRIAQQNAALRDKNQELSAVNQHLAESKAEIVRSGRRAELIFNALTEALPGTTLDDKYRIEAFIGSGGFGTVYRGTHVLLGTKVALKVFKPVPGHDSQRNLDRFRAEGVSAYRVNHPNAVRVLDFGISLDCVAYLVMELLDGRPLSDEIAHGRTLPCDRVVAILRPVLSALAQAHEANVVHRDIKPSNILLCGSGDEEVVKLVDFGIAKVLDASPGLDFKNLTATGLFMGTPNYMAPERFVGKPYDGRSDVYSIGILAYEMLSGSRPFVETADNYFPVAMQHLNDAPPDLGRRVPHVPAELASLVMSALAKDPDDRPTAAEMDAQLARIALGFAGTREAQRG